MNNHLEIIRAPPFTNLGILLKPAEALLGLALIKTPIWQNLSFC
ncbi:hypothetical protein SPONN_117 [uncultured Candidatus Thioglobus sp.]|nr:hypothetical protein SPONN_117 [uncultured Candidatus Thioglobus sp.]